MQIDILHKEFDILQKQYGDKSLNAIYGAGCTKRPDVCFVFMNPTGRNVASDKKWSGLRAPWIGTKNTWRLFNQVGVFDDDIYNTIKEKKPGDWDESFSEEVYREVKNKKLYITNLSKATQPDARPLKDKDFLKYVELIKKEIDILNPKVVISFGNQVSSLLLQQDIRVSTVRKTPFSLEINAHTYKVYPVYYPVGQGMRNIDKSIEDITWILKEK